MNLWSPWGHQTQAGEILRSPSFMVTWHLGNPKFMYEFISYMDSLIVHMSLYMFLKVWSMTKNVGELGCCFHTVVVLKLWRNLAFKPVVVWEDCLAVSLLQPHLVHLLNNAFTAFKSLDVNTCCSDTLQDWNPLHFLNRTCMLFLSLVWVKVFKLH